MFLVVASCDAFLGGGLGFDQPRGTTVVLGLIRFHKIVNFFLGRIFIFTFSCGIILVVLYLNPTFCRTGKSNSASRLGTPQLVIPPSSDQTSNISCSGVESADCS